MRPHDEPPPRITRRGLMLLGIQAGIVGALAWRMRDLQLVQNERYRLLAEENRINIRLIPPARGIITDRNGKVLVSNRLTYTLVFSDEEFESDTDCNDAIFRLLELCRSNNV